MKCAGGPLQNDFVTYKGLCSLSHWLHIGGDAFVYTYSD